MKLKTISIVIGELYNMGYGGRFKNNIIYRFYKPTPKGYNFLNLKSRKNHLKRHMYRLDANPNDRNLRFLVPVSFDIRKAEKKFTYGRK